LVVVLRRRGLCLAAPNDRRCTDRSCITERTAVRIAHKPVSFGERVERAPKEREMTTVDLAHQELLIGGSWTGAKSGREYEQRFPYTGDQVGWAAAAGREDAQAAADAAGAAFPEWSRSAPAMRRQILTRRRIC
jgi:hypothetical protein